MVTTTVSPFSAVLLHNTDKGIALKVYADDIQPIAPRFQLSKEIVAENGRLSGHVATSLEAAVRFFNENPQLILSKETKKIIAKSFAAKKMTIAPVPAGQRGVKQAYRFQR